MTINKAIKMIQNKTFLKATINKTNLSINDQIHFEIHTAIQEDYCHKANLNESFIIHKENEVNFHYTYEDSKGFPHLGHETKKFPANTSIKCNASTFSVHKNVTFATCDVEFGKSYSVYRIQPEPDCSVMFNEEVIVF